MAEIDDPTDLLSILNHEMEDGSAGKTGHLI